MTERNTPRHGRGGRGLYVIRFAATFAATRHPPPSRTPMTLSIGTKPVANGKLGPILSTFARLDGGDLHSARSDLAGRPAQPEGSSTAARKVWYGAAPTTIADSSCHLPAKVLLRRRCPFNVAAVAAGMECALLFQGHCFVIGLDQAQPSQADSCKMDEN